MLQTIASRKSLRTLLVWIGLAVVLIILGQQLTQWAKPGVLPVDDFAQYWAAGRLMISDGDPYDPDQVFPLQKASGWAKDRPLVTLLPPWTLVLLMPFGIFNYPVSRLLWLGLQFGLVLWCADWLWRFYGGPIERRWIAWVIGLTSFPTLFALGIGQISPLLLFGLAGFLYCEKMEKRGWAGVFAALVAIKPHLLYLFWMALLAWIIERKRGSVLLGAGLVGLATMAVSLAVNPAVAGQYIASTSSHAFLGWVSPTLGTALRMLLGWEKIWLQFIPSLLGVIWLLFYWRKHRQAWSWGEQMPLLLLVSLATTSYGWAFDQVALLVAVIQVIASIFHTRWNGIAIGIIASYLSINVLAMLLHRLPIDYFWDIGLAPSLLIWYWAASRQVGSERGEQGIKYIHI